MKRQQVDRGLEGQRVYYRRAYGKAIEDLQATLPLELAGVEDDGFIPSTAIETTLLRVVKAGNSLKALTEVEDG